MSLQFIIGASGAGKTRRLYTDLIAGAQEAPFDTFIALVPEQYSMQAQRDIVDLHPRHGVMNIDILSFERLAWRVFEELAVKQPAILDDMGKSMVLRKVSAGAAKEMTVLSSHLSKSGFIGVLKSQLSEFFQYGITDRELDRLAEETENPLLSLKLKDLAVLTRAFREYTGGKTMAKEEVLSLLAEVLPRSEYIKNSVVTLDGYTGFTPVQQKILEILLRCCKRVVVTVTMDPEENPYRKGPEQELFHLSRVTIHKLIHLAEETGCPREEDILLPGHPAKRLENSPELAFLEEHLFRRKKAVFAVPEKTPGGEQIFLVGAEDPVKEVYFAAAEICRLVKKEGYRYRDIAVISGDQEAYGSLLLRVFGENRIPCFMDKKKSVMGNPLTELIRSALECVDRDFAFDPVFRYMKTGLAFPEGEMFSDLEKAADLAAVAENYCLALGIRGFKRWDAEWTRTYRGNSQLNLQELNEFRSAVFAPLKAFKEEFSERMGTVEKKITALRNLLAALRAEEKMEARRAAFEQAGEALLEKEYAQVYGLVDELLTRITALLGDERMNRKEFMEVLEAGFQELKVGLIPSSVDRVTVGDIVRTRLSGIRALFFVGVNDGIVPQPASLNGVFSDAERRLLKSKDTELAPTVREDSYRQRFYLYLALTRPSERLYLSFAETDTSGAERRPSSLIQQVKELFPEKRIRRVNPVNNALWSPSMGLQNLALGAGRTADGRQEAAWFELYKALLLRPETREEAIKLVNAALWSYRDEGIGRAAARALYGTSLQGSVSRMEEYAECAYRHFLHYGLGLSERQEYELGNADIGNLFHSALEKVFTRMEEEGKNARTITEEERKVMVAEACRETAAEYGGAIMQDSARNAYLVHRLETITDRTVWALLSQLSRGSFDAMGREMTFSPAEGLSGMRFPLSEDEEVLLRGRIDRVDLAEDGDRIYLKIMDYKTGGRSFDLAAVYLGRDLQLILYLRAAKEKIGRIYPEKVVVPAGMYYYHIDDPLIRRAGPSGGELPEAEILKELRPEGPSSGDPGALAALDRAFGASASDWNSPAVRVSQKGGEIAGRSQVISPKQFSLLEDFAGKKVVDFGREILAGTITRNPYKEKQGSSCTWCPYRGVCGFDAALPGYSWRRVPAGNEEDFWKRIEEEKGADDGK